MTHTSSDIISENEAETNRLAGILAQDICKGDIVLLSGDLGTGKSVFSRALIRKLCDIPDLDVPSPTFTLLQEYSCGELLIRHFDLYRIESPEDIYELGWEDELSEKITLVEWPERLDFLAPAHCLEIRFKTIKNKPNQRMITVIKKGNFKYRNFLNVGT